MSGRPTTLTTTTGMEDHNSGVGVDSLDERELDRLCHRLVHVTQDELSTSVDSIHITGSFARGVATPGESDLDIRIVTAGYVSSTELSDLTERIESEEDPERTPAECDSLDIHATPFELLHSEPSVEIWCDENR